jgi:hypothetical protein
MKVPTVSLLLQRAQKVLVQIDHMTNAKRENDKHQSAFTSCGLLACHRSPPNRPGHFDGFNALSDTEPI